MERALNSEYDIMGAFFEDNEKDDKKAASIVKGDKITSLFSFLDD